MELDQLMQDILDQYLSDTQKAILAAIQSNKEVK